MKVVLLAVIAAMTFGCAGYGSTPREKTAAVVNLTLGSPAYAVSYVAGWYLNVLAYATAWIAGEAEGDIPIWFSSLYGPTYASMNTTLPNCWLYTGLEPEDRAIARRLRPGAHIRGEVRLRSLDSEWPPTFAFCRTNIDQMSVRGDESFPLRPIGRKVYHENSNR